MTRLPMHPPRHSSTLTPKHAASLRRFFSHSPMIFDSILKHIPDDARIQDAAVGIFWTFAKTQYGAGMCASAHRWVEDPPGALIEHAGHLVGSRVLDLAPLYRAPSLTARAVALAAISAACGPMAGSCHTMRAQDLLEKHCQAAKSSRSIALIGHFHFADQLRALGHRLMVFELDNRCQNDDIPVSTAKTRLKEADVLVMTSSTLITHATEELISFTRPDTYKMIVGPSVPLSPVLWDFGLDAVCGSVILDPDSVSRGIREGANHKQLAQCQKVCFLKP